MPYKINPITGQFDYYEAPETGGGGGGANLAFVPGVNNGVITSDSGTDATIPLANATEAGLFSATEKAKLAGIATGAEVNVNADWNAVSGDAQILNKPSILPSELIQQTVKASVALTKGTAVYVSDADGTNVIVGKASSATEALSSKTLGLIAQDLAINGIGTVITEGRLAGLDTSTAQIKDPVWLGVDGQLIFGLVNKPVAPAHLVYLGVVTRVNANNGEIFVKVQNGYEIDELHDVSVVGRVNNSLLGYDLASNLHVFKTVPQWLGYTPINSTLVGAASGIVPLNSSSKIDQTYLPSYVDDVLEYDNAGLFPATGETGKIYVALNSNLTYRWSGTGYIEISPSLALGETSATAYRGDRGAIAYNHSLITSGNPHNVTKADVGLGNLPNVDATNPANIVQTSSYRFVTDAEKASWGNAGFNYGLAYAANTMTFL